MSEQYIKYLKCKIHWAQTFQACTLLFYSSEGAGSSAPLCKRRLYWCRMCPAYTLTLWGLETSCFLHVQSLALGAILSLIFFFFFSSWLQIDLEPEGRVYVIIDLSGSSGEGRDFQYFILLFHEWNLQGSLPWKYLKRCVLISSNLY